LCAEISWLAYCKFEADPAARQKVENTLAAVGLPVQDANLLAVARAKRPLATSPHLAVLATAEQKQ
jgi:hypothetical protein